MIKIFDAFIKWMAFFQNRKLIILEPEVISRGTDCKSLPSSLEYTYNSYFWMHILLSKIKNCSFYLSARELFQLVFLKSQFYAPFYFLFYIPNSQWV